MPHNPRFYCRVCRKWCIRRGTRNTHRIAYCPSLTKLCLDCYYNSKDGQKELERYARKRRRKSPRK